MPPRALLAAALVAAGCGASPARPPPTPPPRAELTIAAFEGALAVHGEWITVSRHGRVWRPLRVGAAWQPYLHGEWVWTADGWFWLTDEPWGWATYHYGRWGWDPALGWFWVPGFAWAPAWVAWRLGDGFVGWAPLHPELTVWWVDAYPLEPAHWIFVPLSSFVGVRVERVAVHRSRVPPLVRASRPAPPPAAGRPSPAPPRGGPPARMVEEHVGRPLRPARVVAVPAPSDAQRRGEPGAVPVYRPPPAAARGRPDDARAPPRRRPPPAATPRPPAAEPARAPAAPGPGAAPPDRPKPRTTDDGEEGDP